jgi:hypothetical protein
MEGVALIDVLQTSSLAIGLAACAGLRAWLPLLLAGGLARLGLLELGPSFRFLAEDRALLLFGIATVIEMAADKLPSVDHALDLLSTVLRPASGALLAASLFGRFADPLEAAALGLAVGAPSALIPHAGKAALRAASTAFSAGLANPVLSFLEDMASVALFFIALVAPLAVAAALLLAGILMVRRLRHFGRVLTAVSPT